MFTILLCYTKRYYLLESYKLLYRFAIVTRGNIFHLMIHFCVGLGIHPIDLLAGLEQCLIYALLHQRLVAVPVAVVECNHDEIEFEKETNGRYHTFRNQLRNVIIPNPEEIRFV